MTPRAIIFDLDGTLAESKAPVDAETGVLLKELLARMPVAVMSGGSWKQFEKQLLPAFPKDTNFSNLYLFPVSSAQCLQHTGSAWKTIYSHAFSKEESWRIMETLKAALTEVGLGEDPRPVWGPRIEDRGAQVTFSGLGQDAPPKAKRMWDPDQKKRAPLVALLKERLPGFSVRANAASSIDITREGITKAYGVDEFSKMLAIPAEDILYVGDGLFPGGNDAVVYEACVDRCIDTRLVSGPEDTKALIRTLLKE